MCVCGAWESAFSVSVFEVSTVSVLCFYLYLYGVVVGCWGIFIKYQKKELLFKNILGLEL